MATGITASFRTSNPRSNMKLKAYTKFVVAAVGLAVTLGVLDPGLQQNVAGLLTAIGVFLFPNAE